MLDTLDLDSSGANALVVDMARRFAQERLAPTAGAREASGVIEPEIIAELGELGFLGATISEHWGGAELDYQTYARALIEIAAGDGSVSTLVSVHNAPTCEILAKYGTDAQRERWLRPMTRDAVASFALTEAGAGSDASGVRTRAVKRDGRYVINGSKQFISNARIGQDDYSVRRHGPGCRQARHFRLHRRQRHAGFPRRPSGKQAGAEGQRFLRLVIRRYGSR